MCMEDIRLGRKTVTRTKLVTGTNGGNEIAVGAAANRVSLAFYLTTGDGWIVPEEQATGIINGARIVLGQNHLIFHIMYHGDIVTKQWRINGNGGNVTVLTIEGFLADQ